MKSCENFPPYLEILNKEQREAVLHNGKALLILAGAGSGKTRVITTKIAYLIRERNFDPRSILAVTFTNKAAREMAERARLIEERAEGAMLRTFHSFGAWFLRRNGTNAGLDPGFVIYDDDDVVSLLSSVMEGIPKTEVKVMAHKISRAKDFFLSPEDAELDLIDSRKSFRTTYSAYEKRLAGIGNVDFGDLIKKPVEILRANPVIAERIRSRFRVILVDEYQDANIAQFELLKELCGKDTYVCVVGDDDQSIYRFRGAEVKNILEFPSRFSGTEIVRLEQNYRSTEPILQTASSVVNHNENRLGKKLKSTKGPGKKPVLAFLLNQEQEAAFCAELILKQGKSDYKNWAVLYRTNAQSLGFETEFLHRQIPYQVIGSLKFYEREEIKDALALLSFLVNPKDEVAFKRIVNKPARGLGPASLERIIESAMENDSGDLEAALKHAAVNLSAKAAKGASLFLKAIEAGRETLSEGKFSGKNEFTDDEENEIEDQKKIYEKTKNAKQKKRQSAKRDELFSGEGLSLCLVQLIEKSGISEYHREHDEISGNQRLNNLQELVNAASIYPASFAGLLKFLEHIELDRSMETNNAASGDYVTLITLHNTKGLEFKKVIITGLEQGIFPREDKSGDDLEEERRLFYVGSTRAMDELYLTSCRERRMYGEAKNMEASLFLHEIDKNLVKIIGSAPLSFKSAYPENNKFSGINFNPVKKTVVSSDGRWQIGDRIFHDDHGYGGVTGITESEDGPVITAIFDSGGNTRFLSEYQSGAYTKISND